LSQEVFDFGRIAAQTAALEAGVEIEKQRATGADLDVSYSVASSYFAVQGARSVLTAAEGAYARAVAHRDLARAGVASGMRPPIELARAEADVMRFDVGRIRARGGLAAAQAQLAAAVGAPDAALDAADDPAAVAASAPSLEAALRDAAARDPVILEAIARLKAQEARTRAIRAEMRPNLWLTGAFTGRGGGAEPSNGEPSIGNGWAPTVPNWHVGLILSWRILDMTTIARADASRAREQVQRAELDGARQQQVAAVQRAVLVEAAARDAVPALERARDAARASYAQVEARYKAGLATSVELADAEALRTEAEIQEAVGRFEAARARSALGRAIGENPWSKRGR
jgi:outer membrane protein